MSRPLMIAPACTALAAVTGPGTSSKTVQQTPNFHHGATLNAFHRQT